MITHNNGIKQSLQQQQTTSSITLNTNNFNININNNTILNNNNNDKNISTLIDQEINYEWKIATYNIRGLNDNSKVQILEEWIIQNDLDFTILTETKLRPNNKPKFNELAGMHTSFFDSSDTHTYGKGVAIVMKNQWARHVESISKLNGRLLHLTLKFKGKKTIHIIGCYAPAATTEKDKKETKQIINYINNIIIKNEQTIIAGDFNEDYQLYNNNHNKCPITTNILEKGYTNIQDKIQNNDQLYYTWKSYNSKEHLITYLLTVS
jgi:endonuclease/exonuclease/phosphatase (EEP) superfamily protein YafD